MVAPESLPRQRRLLRQRLIAELEKAWAPPTADEAKLTRLMREYHDVSAKIETAVEAGTPIGNPAVMADVERTGEISEELLELLEGDKVRREHTAEGNDIVCDLVHHLLIAKLGMVDALSDDLGLPRPAYLHAQAQAILTPRPAKGDK
jgi:hypothetical protein